MEDTLLGSTQVCQRLGISRGTLGQWMDKGWITPLSNLPGGYIFTEAEVARAKAEHRPEVKAS
jgi:predicted site-specific integrase-resolvase